MIHTPEGVGVTVDAAIATRVEAGELTVCWSGSCQTRPLALRPGSRVVDESCSGSGPDDVCAARAEPTDEGTGFVDIAGMPASPVEVTVRLTDLAGSPIVDETVTVDPKLPDSAGECGGVGPQGRIGVGADGKAYPIDQ